MESRFKRISAVTVTVLFLLNQVFATMTFDTATSRIILKNSNSEIRLNPSTVLGWRDSSIVNSVSGIGLGDYNLKQYDYSTNNILTYAEVNNSMQYINWNIPDNTIVHIQNNILMDGYGGTINLGNNSELFVDDNVTLTLRNVVVKNTKNFVGNPAIKLASNRSKLTLDNTTLDITGDFYFNRGQLFVNNDVKFTGTSAFVYRSPMPSFITSGAKLFFDIGTTFSVAPATFTDCPYSIKSTYTTNNFIRMADQTSQIYLNGCSFFTTMTGCRFRTGSLFLGNKVTMNSNSASAINVTVPMVSLGSVGTGSQPQSVSWSPDGRFLAVVNNSGFTLQIFSFSGSGNPTLIGSVGTGGGTYPYSVSWSPDGRFLAVANSGGPTLQIFSFNGSGNPTLIGSAGTATSPYSVSWSPDGRFLAVGNETTNSLQIFSFSGSGNPTLIGSVGTGNQPHSVSWSPDGRFLTVVNYLDYTLQIFSFSGSGNPTLIGSVGTGSHPNSVSWSPDGRFLAVVNLNDNTLQIFSFSGSGNPTLIGSVGTGGGTYPWSVSWSPDGRFIAVGNGGSHTLQIFSFSGSGNPTLIGSVGTGTYPTSVSWSPDGRFLAVVNYTDNTLQVFGVNYVVDRSTQALSNSIVFGNSALGSSSDLKLQLLSGANVSVDGTVNYDNVNSTSIFSNDNAKIILKNSNSAIKLGPATVLGWQDSSIIANAANAGLGDYNLLSDDQNLDKIINYPGVPNTLLGSNWNIPANTVVHVSNNAVLDGNGNTINLGANSQIFVDDTVTLTLRNVVISNNQNFGGNPPIALATNRSKLVLDNAKLNFVNDFYFNQGELFAYNDVNFTGTSSFIYRSTVPSYIMSGANLKFNPKTTFYFEPSTSGTTTLLAKDLLIMGDATSKLTLDGTTLKTTLTGMRLTKGQLLLGNNVTMTSATSFRATGTSAVLNLGGIANAYREIDKLQWSPDGRKLAVAGRTRAVTYSAGVSGNLAVYLFSGTTTTTMSTVDFSVTASGVSWSPDGQYVAAGGKVSLPASLGLSVSTSNLQVYSVVNNSLSPVTQANLGTTLASYAGTVSWSPDGHYLAVGGNMRNLTIYQFNGNSLNQISTATTAEVLGIAWHPSGKYVAIATNSATASIAIYAVNNGVLGVSALSTRNYASGYGTSVSWSPDGNYLATTGLVSGSGAMYVYSVNSAATSTVQVSALNFGTSARTVKWSPDGRFLLVGGNDIPSRDLVLYIEFPSLNIIKTVSFGTYVYSTDIHPSGLYLTTGGFTPTPASYQSLSIGVLAYGQETTGQAISNSIVFGNSASGSSYDLNLQLLSGANVAIDGIVNYDNVNSTSIFNNDNARFVLKNSNSEIRMNPATVVGWRDRSLIKNLTGAGLGDFNVKSYGSNNLVTYAQSGGELVYDNSNAIVSLTVTERTNSNAFAYGIKNTSNWVNQWATTVKQTSNSVNAWVPVVRTTSNWVNQWGATVKQTSNTANWLSMRVRTDSNTFLYGIKNTSNWVNQWATTVKQTSNSVNAWVPVVRTTSNWVNQWGATVKQTSNTANWLSMRVRTDSNTFLYGIKNTSNWVNQWATTVKQTSNSVNAWVPVVRTTSNWVNQWGATVKQTSNTANWLSMRVRTDSNALLALNRTTSNALLLLNRTTSNALLFGDRNNSNAIIKLGVTERTNSNAFAYGIKNTSNWINQWATTVKQTSNSMNYWAPVVKANSNWINQWAMTVKQTSNSANWLNTRVRTDSNALLALNRTTSNALLLLNRTTSNALLFGDRNNSNAIISLGVAFRTTSNASAYKSKNNSNAIISLGITARTNSNAFAYEIKNDSNSIVNIYNNFLGDVQVFNTQQVYNHPATIQNFVWYKAGFQVDPGVILALNTPIPVNGQISLGGTLTLSSDLFLESGATFTSCYGFGEILGNGNAIHLGGNLAIPSNNIMHIGANTIIEGHGNTVNLGANAEIFVDDNVTLTLRNVIVANTENFLSNPAIKLASNRSKLVLDNSTLDFIGDFYFSRGQLFVNNDVKFTGTSSLVYKSPMASFITSGAHLFFDKNTTFSCAPATFTDCPYTYHSTYTASNFIRMADATSTIIFDGCSYSTTPTGLRLTTGAVRFDNQVTLNSKASFFVNLANALTSLGTANTGSSPLAVVWSPDERFLAAISTNLLQIFSVNAGVPSSSPVSTASLANSPQSVTWSPDGRFIAVVSFAGNSLQVFGISGGILSSSPIGTATTGSNPQSATWSQDGRFLAVANYTSSTLQIFSFNGSGAPVPVGSVSTGTNPYSISWSPDERFLAVSNYTSPSVLQIFNFNGAANPTQVGSNVSIGSSGRSAVAWSPDGRFLAVTNQAAGTLDVFNFNGSNTPLLVGSVAPASPSDAAWSTDGRFIGVLSQSLNLLEIYLFTGSGAPILGAAVSTGSSPIWASESPNAKYIAVANNGNSTIQVFGINFAPDPTPQAISNSIVFGNSALGSASDLNVKLLSGSNVSVNGIVNYDNTLGYTVFSNDNSRFILKNSNSKIHMTPNTVVGWRDRSLIKNITGGGLGDFNLQTYALGNTAPNINTVTYAESGGELVYGNSNAIVGLTVTTRTNSNAFAYEIKNNSNAIIKLCVTERTNSNAFAYGIKNNSNAIIKLGVIERTNSNAFAYEIKNNSNAIIKLAQESPTSLLIQTSNAVNYLSPLVRTNSNAFVYEIKNNSNAIVRLNTISGVLPIQNSNAIIKLAQESPTSLLIQTSNAANYLSAVVRTDSNAFAYEIKNNSNAIIALRAITSTLPIQNSNAIVSWISQTSNTTNWLSMAVRTDSNALLALNRTNSNAFAYGIKNDSNSIVNIYNNFLGDVQVFNTQQVYNHPATIQNFVWYKAGFQVDPGVILALNTPIPVNGQISLGGTLTLSSDLFLESGATFTSCYGFGEILGNGNAIHLGGNLAIPSNNIMHIGANTIIEGHGNTVNLGANAEIFVDDNVTLTLRNVIVANTENFLSNPAIKLASNRSKLVLDNSTLDFIGDFYFSRGQLFVNNDVKFTGTSSLVYKSPMASFITSGAHLFFDKNTTFSCAPATFTDCPYTYHSTYTASNFIRMADATSTIIFDGCSYSTTPTGLRLTTGAVRFDNQVTLNSKASFFVNLANALTSLGTANTGSSPLAVVWSPDERFLAAISTNLLQIFSVNAGVPSSSPVSTASLANSPQSVTWSPDGRFIAVVSFAGNSLQVFGISGGILSSSPIGTATTGSNPQSATWSQDGRFLAVANYTSSTLQIFSFNGSGAPVLVGSVSTETNPYSISWSPDERFLAVSNYTSPSVLQIFNFNGAANPTQVGSNVSIGSSGRSAVAWSPDGRFLAVTNQAAGTLDVFNFNGSNTPLLVGSVAPASPSDAAWSTDGRFIGVLSQSLNLLEIYLFTGSGAPILGAAVSTGSSPIWASESPNAKYIAVANNGNSTIQVFGINFAPDPTPQAISNSIVFGNSALGSASDLNVKLLSGSNVSVNGIVNYDNTLGYTVFSNDNSRFILKNSNSKIHMTPNTVVGWRDRSLIKNITGGGLGDFNLQTYALGNTAPNINTVTYAESGGELVYGNSNAIVGLGVTARTNSNAFAYEIKNNSNAIIKLGITERTNSNAFAYGIKNNSNAIIKLGVTERTNSNAFAYGIKNNSNWINQWAMTVKQTSNSANWLNTRVRTDSNAFLYGIKNSSNALLALNRTTSNALLFGDRNNSNAIIKLGVTERTNSNAFAYGIKNNSNAIIKLGVTERTNSNAFAYGIKNNSNAIIKLCVTERTNSNACAYRIKNNSNAIIKLCVTERTNSNAFAYGIKNNSNAIIKLGQSGSIALATQNSNAIVSWIKGTSNAVIKLSGTAPAVLPINNSNAIIKLNASLQTIDHGPNAIQINTPTYTMTYDFYLSIDHILNIQNSCIFDGNGHTIYFAKDSPNILIIAAGNVVLNNVVLKNFDDSSVQLGGGATLTFGDGCRVDLADEQSMTMPWIFAGNSAINGCGNPLELGLQNIQIMPSGNLTIENIILEGLQNTNVQCLGSNANITLKNATLQITGDYNFAVGSLIFEDQVLIKSQNEFSLSNAFIYASDQISTINKYSTLKLDYGVLFYYAPSAPSRDLIAMQDVSSELYLNGCTLATSSIGMRLTKGTLTVDSNNILIDVLFGTPTSIAESICFGSGITSNDDLAINILPGGQLDIANGILDYQNVN